MAATTVHFALGMAVGSAVVLPKLVRTWQKKGPLAREFRRWLFLAYGLGLFAVFPAILRRLGVPGAVSDGWWMNVFLAYPLINMLKQGGMKTGAALAGGIFCVQYGCLLLAIRRQRRRS